MKASSKAEVRLFKQVVKYQNQTLIGRPPDRVKQIAKSITNEAVIEFAKTPMTHLPEHVRPK